MEDAFIRFLCPGCGKRCKAPPDYAGKLARCTSCRQKLQVPGQVIQYEEELHHSEEVDQTGDLSELSEDYSDDIEEASTSPPTWPAMVAFGVGGLLAAVLLVIALV